MKADSGLRTETSHLVYSLQTSGEFQLDSVSGKLHTVRPLDHEAAQSSSAVFTLFVCVHVHQSPSLVDCTNVTIDVLDVNDNRPSVQRV